MILAHACTHSHYINNAHKHTNTLTPQTMKYAHTHLPTHTHTQTQSKSNTAQMPSLTTAKGRKRGSSVRIDYSAIWEVRVPANITDDGQGTYTYTGPGGSIQEDIGTLRTLKPLCHMQQHEGMASFEITIVDTGKTCIAKIVRCSCTDRAAIQTMMTCTCIHVASARNLPPT